MDAPRLAADEVEVAQVDEDAQGLPDDEHRIAPVHGVGEEEERAGDAQEPERHGDDAPPLALAREPLDDEAAREDQLPDEPEHEPEGAHAPTSRRAGTVTSDRTRAATARRWSHQTPNRSASPTHSRLLMPYLVLPRSRGRW